MCACVFCEAEIERLVGQNSGGGKQREDFSERENQYVTEIASLNERLEAAEVASGAAHSFFSY